MVTSDVKPAINSEPKKRTPKIGPPVMLLMIVGKAINARPMPLVATSATATCWVTATKPKVANTPMLARTSKALLDRPTTAPRPERFARFCR